MSSLSLKHVFKVYPGGVRAVNDFNLEIQDKEFVVFVGPSGCGKSTTLRMIAGIEDITAGHLFIDNQLVNHVDSKDRDIAMVFQSYALYPHMTVYQNMAFGLKLRHVPAEEIDQRVRRAAEVLEISNLLDRKPKELSGGQRQRVALGRAIVRKANVFLLDEPLSNLDAKLRVQMRTEITKLHESLKTTFIYVTHDQTEAMTMGDKIVVMKDGRIQQADSPISLFEDPANLFVATFLGAPQMNIIEVKLSVKGKKLYATFAENKNVSITLSDAILKQLQASKYDLNREILLGIRPDHVVLGKEGVPATIDVVEQLGDETILHCKVENKEKNIVVKSSLTGLIKEGDKVHLKFFENSIYLFDKKNQNSIVGVPALNKLECSLTKNGIAVGNQVIPMDQKFFSHLIKPMINGKIYVGFKPEDVYLNHQVGTHQIKAKVDFSVKKTQYFVHYSKVEGLNSYLVFKSPLDKEYKKGSTVTLYVPHNSINIYNENGDRLLSRETLLSNSAYVTVKHGKDVTHIHFNGGGHLTYPHLNIEEGDYLFTLDMTKSKVIYTNKLRKSIKKQNRKLKKKKKHTFVPIPEIEKQEFNSNQVLEFSCYDEDVIGSKNLVYGQIRGFKDYVSLLCENNFTVYSMPRFFLEVPSDGFTLKSVTNINSIKEDELGLSTFIKPFQRVRYDENDKALYMNHSLSGFEVNFKGSELKAKFISNKMKDKLTPPYITVVVDNQFDDAKFVRATEEMTLCSGLEGNRIHNVKVYKSNSGCMNFLGLTSLTTNGYFEENNDKDSKYNIEFYGDSLTCGTGTAATHNKEYYPSSEENSALAYPFLTGRYLNANVSVIAAGGYPLYKSPYIDNSIIRSIPEAVSLIDFNETTRTEDRHYFDHSLFIPEVVVINLGTNDKGYLATLKGDKKAKELIAFKDAYVSFVNTLLTINPTSRIVLMANKHYMSDEIVNKINEIKNEFLGKNVFLFEYHVDENISGGFVSNGHMNAKMHEAVAKELAEFIKKNKLLK